MRWFLQHLFFLLSCPFLNICSYYPFRISFAWQTNNTKQWNMLWILRLTYKFVVASFDFCKNNLKCIGNFPLTRGGCQLRVWQFPGPRWKRKRASQKKLGKLELIELRRQPELFKHLYNSYWNLYYSLNPRPFAAIFAIFCKIFPSIYESNKVTSGATYIHS